MRRKIAIPLPNSWRRSAPYRHPCCWALPVLCLVACSEAPEQPVTAADPWSNQEEVLHQTREVIRYVDDQQQLKMERLRELGVDSAVSPAQR